MRKDNWNYKTEKQTLRTLRKAFKLDFTKVTKKTIRLMLKNEKKALLRKNSIVPRIALFYLNRYLETNKYSPCLFYFRSMFLKYTNLPNYVNERNKIVNFYTNYAKKHCNYNTELYHNLLIGIISGIDNYKPNKRYSLGAVIIQYAKKHANFDFDAAYDYPYRIKATDFFKIKNKKIPIYKAVPYTEWLHTQE